MIRGQKGREGKTVMDKEYLDHAVFNSLCDASQFYHDLADNVMRFVPKWVKSHPITNYDSYFFEALANSIVSIKTILELGHITDAKVLLRNFFDETIINLYFIARLKKQDNDLLKVIAKDISLVKGVKVEDLYDVNTSDWLSDNKTKALQRALRYEEMVKCLKQEVCIAEFVEYLDSHECEKMREWLNDAVHLNYYKAVLLNDGRLCIDGERKSEVDRFKDAFDQIIMFHVICVFCLEPVYLMSSDYMDYLDCGDTPPDGCQYNVSPFIQPYLEKTVYKFNPAWAEKLVRVVMPMRLRKQESIG